jgi:murein DD-endopeptidase MepM/ murein hydrolase activator NlpD
MANSTVAYKSSISVSNIKKSVSSLGRGIKRAQGSALSLSQSISRRNETKRQGISTRAGLFQKRQEAVRRREQEDIVEASGVTGAIRRTRKVVMNSTKGFLGRILDYIGTLLVGWALVNLPTIIRLGEELINRIQRLTTVMSTFIRDTTQFLFGFGQLLDGVTRNLISLDFTDSQGRVSKAMEQMQSSFRRMEDSVFDGLKILTEPIDFQIEEGTRGPEAEPTLPGEPTSPKQPTSPREETTGGGKVLNPQAGYSYLRQLGVPHIHALGILANIKGESGFRIDSKQPDGPGIGLFQYSSAGRKQAFLQNVPDWKTNWKGQIKYAIGEDRGPAYLKTQFSSPEQAAYWWMDEWERPAASVYRERNEKHNKFIKDFKPSSGQKQESVKITRTGSLRPNDILTDSIGRGVQYIQIGDVMGAPRGNGRKHAGIDIQCPANTCIALRVDCEVMFAGWQNPADHNSGYGLVIDVWVPELGVQLRFGHCAGFFITNGKVPAGRSFARVGSTGASTGPHIHFEYTKQRGSSAGGSDGDPSPYVSYILLTNKPNYSSFTVPGKGRISAAPAQISVEQGRDVKELKREKKDNVLMVPLPQSAQRKPAIIPMSGGDVGLSVDDSLNRFVTQKLLLDLAYS